MSELQSIRGNIIPCASYIAFNRFVLCASSVSFDPGTMIR